ncbi:MAG: hypothetical protein HOQ24_16075 [Mycobacteriaceae bacterium]|nr:hypothetical protein [Mycobacteriaceae bacterium]
MALAPAMTVVSCVIAVVRCAVMRGTVGERRMNHTLVLLVVSVLAVEPRAARALGYSAAFGFQLGAAAVVGAGAAGYLLTTTWLAMAVRPQATYAAAGVCVAAMFRFGADARQAGAVMTDYVGWTVLAFWLCFVIVPFWCDFSVLRACIPELRGRPQRREAVTYGAVGLSSAFASLFKLAVLATAVCLAADRRNGLTELLHAHFIDGLRLYTFVVAVLSAVSVVSAELGRYRLSRQLNRLAPLWADVTGACPEVVLPAPAAVPGDPVRYRLHRTIVEIRDCMVILSRYADRDSAGRGDDVLARAVRLARAADAKRNGDPPVRGRPAGHGPTHDLFDETAELEQLARVWPAARTIARGPIPSS